MLVVFQCQKLFHFKQLSLAYKKLFNLRFLNEYLDKILDNQDFIYLHTINLFQFIFLVQALLKKGKLLQKIWIETNKTSSILTFSNRYIKLFTLKNRFLVRAKTLHSVRTCLTVRGVWHVKRCGYSFFNMKEWVSLVWPMCIRDVMTCFLLNSERCFPFSPKWAGFGRVYCGC